MDRPVLPLVTKCALGLLLADAEESDLFVSMNFKPLVFERYQVDWEGRISEAMWINDRRFKETRYPVGKTEST
jgi:hypothetical protein